MQAFYLAVKYLLGWGRDPDELRYLSKEAFGISRFYVMLISAIFLLKLHDLYVEYFPTHAFWTNAVPLIGIYLVSAIWIGFSAGTWYSALARRGEARGTAVAWGQCYRVIYQAKLVIFARIGATTASAQWYVLPESWEATLRSPGATFELDILNGTGYVTQLRRLGAQPQTLNQDDMFGDQTPTIDEQASALGMDAIYMPPRPAKIEQRELRRATRPKGGYWGISLASMIVLVITCLLSGIISIGLIIWFDLSIQAIPRKFTSSDIITFVLFSGFFALLGLGLIVWGIALLPLTLRLYRVRHESDEIIVGTVVSWAIFRGLGNDSGMTITKIQLDSGKERIFCVQQRFIRRARTIGARVQLHYRPISEHVMHLVMLAAPADVRGETHDPSA